MLLYSNCIHVLLHCRGIDQTKSLYIGTRWSCQRSFRFVSQQKKKASTLVYLHRNREPCDISGRSGLFMSAALWFYGFCLMLTKAGGTSCLSEAIKPQVFFFFFGKLLLFGRATEGQTNFHAFYQHFCQWAGRPPQVEQDTWRDCLYKAAAAAATVHCQSGCVRSSHTD